MEAEGEDLSGGGGKVEESRRYGVRGLRMEGRGREVGPGGMGEI